jgi:hypothetical protein
LIIAIKAAIAAYAVAAQLLNIAHDSPHASESRPAYAEVCATSAHDRYPIELVTVNGRDSLLAVNFSGSPSGSERVFDVGPHNHPGTTIRPAIWVEIARDGGYVCDGTGEILYTTTTKG